MLKINDFLFLRVIPFLMLLEMSEQSPFSIFSFSKQVLKPLDVKTKFYNAEVSAAVVRFV